MKRQETLIRLRSAITGHNYVSTFLARLKAKDTFANRATLQKKQRGHEAKTAEVSQVCIKRDVVV